jgi:restriction system protein
MQNNPGQETLIANGDTAFNQGNYPSALSYYSQALQHEPQNTLILSRMGNTYHAMEIHTTATVFYDEALNNSGAYTVICQYALAQAQPPGLHDLQDSLRTNYQVEITMEGLDFILANAKKDLHRQKTQARQATKRQSRKMERMLINFFKKAKIPYVAEILDVASQVKHSMQQTTLENPPATLKRMTGPQFVTFMQKLFEMQGYQVTRKRPTHDYGGDLIIRKPGITIVVQAKKRKTSTIGVRAIQEVYTAKAYYQADHALAVTTTRFTRPALKLAEKLGVECWDREKIEAELRKTLYKY